MSYVSAGGELDVRTVHACSWRGIPLQPHTPPAEMSSTSSDRNVSKYKARDFHEKTMSLGPQSTPLVMTLVYILYVHT